MRRCARLDAAKTLHHVIVRGIEKRKMVDDVAEIYKNEKVSVTIANTTGRNLQAPCTKETSRLPRNLLAESGKKHAAGSSST